MTNQSINYYIASIYRKQMPGSRRNQKKSNKNKNNKILKRMKELSNYYRKKLFRGGALDEAQVARMAELEAKKTTGLSTEEQTEYDSLIAIRDAPTQATPSSPEVESSVTESIEVQPETQIEPIPAEEPSLLEKAGNAVGSVLSAVGMTSAEEVKKGGRRSNKRSNKRRNNKKQSQRKRR
jgi:hypothetical protein